MSEASLIGSRSVGLVPRRRSFRGRSNLVGMVPRPPSFRGRSRSRSRLCPGEKFSLLRAPREKRGASQNADPFFRSHRVMLSSRVTEGNTFVRHSGISTFVREMRDNRGVNVGLFWNPTLPPCLVLRAGLCVFWGS